MSWADAYADLVDYLLEGERSMRNGPGEYLLDQMASGGCVETRPEEKPAKKKKAKPLSEQVAQLEADFKYQNEYNLELIGELKAANEATLNVQGEFGEYRARQLELLGRKNKEIIEQHVEITGLKVRVAQLSRPHRFWRRVSALLFLVASSLGGVIVYEKIAGEPIDKLANRVIIELSTGLSP